MKKKLKLKKSVKIILCLIIISSIGYYKYNIYLQEQKVKESLDYKLTDVGYTKNEITLLTTTFDEDTVLSFTEKSKDEQTLEIISNEYFILNNYTSYLDYLTLNRHADIDYTITLVNTNTHIDYYDTLYESDENNEYLMLINKYYGLKSTFIPTNLTTISIHDSWGESGTQMIKEVVYNAFTNMKDAAKSYEINLMINTSYRSYESQDNIYTAYKEDRGMRYADTYAARAGHSEHQTGLALDIYSLEDPSKATFEGSNTYNWLILNCYKYGFILRYPSDKTEITGFDSEPWHYRYVGIDVATEIHNLNITFDEYYAYYIDNN